MKPMRPRSSRSAMSLVRAASTSRIAFSGEIGSIVTRDRAHHLRVEEERREEGGADVDSRPARDPVGRVERAVGPVGAPRRLGRRPARRRPRRCRRARGRPPRDARGPGRDQGSNATRIALASIPGRSAPTTWTSAAASRSAERLELAQQHARTRRRPGPSLPPARLICRHARFASIWRQTNSS